MSYWESGEEMFSLEILRKNKLVAQIGSSQSVWHFLLGIMGCQMHRRGDLSLPRVTEHCIAEGVC